VNRNLPGILGLAGLALLASSILLANESLYLVTDGKRAEGTVMRAQLGSDGSGDRYSGIVYQAVIQFQTESGEDTEFRSQKSNKPLYRWGSRSWCWSTMPMLRKRPGSLVSVPYGPLPWSLRSWGGGVLGSSVGFAIRRRRQGMKSAT